MPEKTVKRRLQNASCKIVTLSACLVLRGYDSAHSGEGWWRV
jgi:hypothetical protein